MPNPLRNRPRRARHLARSLFIAGMAIGVGILQIACGSCEPEARSAAAAPRPNIIVLLSDDQNWDSVGISGRSRVATPGIDRIGQEGVYFRNAFVTTSLCSPSRASFLTGQYVRRHRIVDNRTPLPHETVTLASLLSGAGYDTASIGKWHFGKQAGPRPGFRYTAGYEYQGRYYNNDYYVGRDTLEKSVREEWVEDVSTQYAVDFVSRERDGPFFLLLGYKGLHAPRLPAKRHEALYGDLDLLDRPHSEALPPYPRKGEIQKLAAAAGTTIFDYQIPEFWRTQLGEPRLALEPRRRDELEVELRDYYRVLAGIDENVDRLLAVLDELEIANDTVVVFASDNGFSLGAHGEFGKRSAYEESIRIPFLIRYPARFAAGTVSRELVLNVDLAPTLLELAGVPRPESMQGRSLVPLLEGRRGEARRDFVYEFFLGARFQMPDVVALRSEHWKLVEYPGYESWTELFDLREDPFEQRNLATLPAHRETLDRMKASLAEREAALGPRLAPALQVE